MRKAFLTLCVVLLTLIGSAVPAQSQLRFGLRAGATVNSLHFSSETFQAENRAGYTLGAMLEFTVPVSGIGVDASVMYVRRNSRWLNENQMTRDDRDYIDIPINLKWRINIPVINNIIRPFLATGPSFAFLTSRRSAANAWNNRKFDTSWNFGFGVELFKHLQVGASYGIGLTKALKATGITGTSNINGHNRYWTIAATYLF